MGLVYLALGLPLVPFAMGFAPFLLQEYFGKKGMIIGWVGCVYIWVTTIFGFQMPHHHPPPPGLGQFVWLFTWWAHL